MGDNRLDRGFDIFPWWAANLGAILPALVVGTLVYYTTAQPNELLAGTVAWGIGAAFAATALELWHKITKRFSTPNFWTAMSIGAILGAVVALCAGISAPDTIAAALRATAGFLGTVQGAVVAWHIARPDWDVPPVLQSDSDESAPADAPLSGSDPPNPPTSTR